MRARALSLPHTYGVPARAPVAACCGGYLGLAFAAGAFGGMQQKELSDGIVHAFRTGIGMSYRAMSLVLGEESVGNSKRMLATWTKGILVPVVIPALAGGAMAARLSVRAN